MSISKNLGDGKAATYTAKSGDNSITVELIRGGPLEIVILHIKGANEKMALTEAGKSRTIPLANVASVIIKAIHAGRISYSVSRPADPPEKNKDWWKKPMR